ncbi:MAG: hypothetical protein ABEK10_00545 [Candidatus Nanosalina sp.]
MRKPVVIPLLVILSTSILAQSVGVAPAYTSLGTIQRGESKTVTLYVTSNSDSPFNVKPSFEQPFTAEKFGGKISEASEVSGEDISDWITFEKNLYAVTPSNSTLAVIGEGLTISASGKVSYTVSVPRDAEPGYHSGRIRLSPVLDAGTGYGASVVAQASSKFEFRVPGNVQRDMEVKDVNAYRLEEDMVRIDTRIKNTGTVTTTVNSTKFLIQNYVGENIKRVSEGSFRLAPGESEWITSYWNGKEVQEGEYQFKGTVDYMTGTSFASQTFSVGDSINITAPDTDELDQNTGREKLPVWLVLMFLVLVGVLMYSFEIDPTVILMVIALLSGGTLILISKISNSMILVLLTTSVAITYIWYR